MYQNVLHRGILAVFIFLGAVYGSSEFSQFNNSKEQESSSSVFTDLQIRITKRSSRLSMIDLTEDGENICFCLCDNPENFPLPQTEEETLAFIEDYKKEVNTKLLVNKKKLSSTASKKGSIVDRRPSAAYVGSLGIIMLLVVFLSLALLDLPRVFIFYKSFKYEH